MEPWRTYHNPEALKNAWRIALIGGPIVFGWLLIAFMAPVKVPIVQGIALVAGIMVCASVIRLGSERISTDASGVAVYGAFRPAVHVAWPDLASLDIRTETVHGPRGDDIESLAATLFDLDSDSLAHQVVKLTLVMRDGRKIPVPCADENARALIELSWREYTTQFGRSLFND